MAAKGQTEATCNVGNTNKIAEEVEKMKEEEEGNSTINDAYVNFKDFQKAIEYHERDLEISKELGDRAGEGKAYGNLGNAYHSLGDFQKAVEYHERHLETGQKKEGRTVILAKPMKVLEISRKA